MPSGPFRRSRGRHVDHRVACTTVTSQLVETAAPDKLDEFVYARGADARRDAAWRLPQVEERQLLKAMTWWDGFVVALANPGFLIAALGGSIGALGTAGAFVLWTISIILGALQNNIHAELASMFPNKSGGIALYAHEAWRKYLTVIGPLATFGYWIGWSVVLSINGLVAGTLIQARVVLATRLDRVAAPASTSRCRSSSASGLIVLVWALQRLRRPAGGLVRLRDRRPAAASRASC